jgi:DNA invertase Pin-like site-specific DNA recombinase
MEYVSYIRTSTKEQNIGLEAQQTTIDNFLKSYGGEIVETFIEQVSGSKNDRIELTKALTLCKKNGYTLLSAKLDRISRKVSFIANLMESKISFKVAEMPSADTFQLHIYAALGEQERNLISMRTKQALAVRKRQGVKLGENGKVLAAKYKKEASNFANGLTDIISELKASGITSLYGISKCLNERKIKTRKGGKWYPQTVSNYLAKILNAA